VFPTVTGYDDVAASGPDARGSAGDEIRIAAIAAEAFESSRQVGAVSFGESAGPLDVPPGEI